MRSSNDPVDLIAQAAALAVRNARFDDAWVSIPVPPHGAPAGLTAAWRNRDFLVQEYRNGPAVRLSINRTTIGPGGRWRDGITWDELQAIKAAVGYGDAWCVEVYPPDDQVVNVANIRHLFVLDERPPYAWTNGRSEGPLPLQARLVPCSTGSDE